MPYPIYFQRAVSETSWLKLGLAIGGVLLLAIIATMFVPWLFWFRRELRYLNMEIHRNYGPERTHWEKRKKRLWLSLLPFFHY